MAALKPDPSSSIPVFQVDSQPQGANRLPKRTQSASHRSSRSNNNNNNPFLKHRPDYQRSLSSDPIVSPLQTIRQETKTARRAPHLKRVVPTDIIDNLDATGLGPYHHEGPYDATLASRQIPGRAPVEAVRYGNAAALAATPTANVLDSLTKKVPLQGIGLIPPGGIGPGGERFDYEEEDLMHMDGRLGRWPGVEYRDEDVKGKGEPGYTQDLLDKQMNAIKKQGMHSPMFGNGEGALEMQNYPSGRKRSVSDASPHIRYEALDRPEVADASGLRKFGNLKKRFSLRRKKSKF